MKLSLPTNLGTELFYAAIILIIVIGYSQSNEGKWHDSYLVILGIAAFSIQVFKIVYVLIKGLRNKNGANVELKNPNP
jgi:hypothetical protein